MKVDERFLPQDLNEIAVEHLHRYSMITEIINNKVVLDIASGEGYGTFMISKNAKFVYGVDVSEESINKSIIKYNSSNVKYMTGDATSIPIEDKSIDVVVSFETIEHLTNHEKMVSEIKRVLKPEGILIMSTPNKENYSDKLSFSNPYHIKELYKEEFEKLICGRFKFVEFYSQKFVSGSLIVKNSKSKNSDFLIYGDTNEISNVYDFIGNSIYMITVASDFESHLFSDSIYYHDINNIINRSLNVSMNSNSYKIGNFILKPFSFIKRKFF